MSIRTMRRPLLATGHWSQRPARCPRLTLEHRRRRCEWVGCTECGTADNGEAVSSVMSPSSSYTTVAVGSGCAIGKERG